MKFFFPNVCLPPWLAFQTKIRMIKSAGFDGVEFFLIGRNAKSRAGEYYHETYQQGLGLRLHQGWSENESNERTNGRVLGALGLLPPNGYSLWSHMPMGTEKIVVFPDRIAEIMPQASGTPNRFVVQTATTYDASRACQSMDYDEMREAIVKSGLPTCFDTMHAVENYCGVHVVRDNPDFYPRAVNNTLLRVWDDLGGRRCEEIHFNNFADGGRWNTLPSVGLLNLAHFVRIVKASGWDGIVTPEVNPRHFLWDTKQKLLGLRKSLESFWGC